MKQLDLFHNEVSQVVKRPQGNSTSSIVFHDYESFIAKFHAAREKTTDDCYTPQDVYEAVVRYVGNVIDLSDKVILRPFFPGGDYESAEYPENGVVIDNPPFSIFKNCCKFYSQNNIPFFLFGPGLTIGNCFPYCTAVIATNNITFDNGAVVPCNFASNLYGDVIITTAPELYNLIKNCPSQVKPTKSLPKFQYPPELLSVSTMNTLVHADIEFAVRRSECVIVDKLDSHLRRKLFGSHLLLSSRLAAKKEAAKKEAAKKEAAKGLVVELSPRERRIIDNLDKNTCNE